jgi:RimJ/RimL family protein N-acetyltransferase
MPILVTPRALLRPWTMEDLDAVARICADPEVMRLYETGEPWSREKTEQVLIKRIEHEREHGFSLWAAVLQDTGKLIGHCGLIDCPDSGEIELSYALARAHWGQGFATELARATLEHGLHVLGLGRIAAVSYPENAASIRVLEKIGMRFERTFKQYGAELRMYGVERVK